MEKLGDDVSKTHVKVEVKEWANPTPAGLVALAVACFIFYALLTGKVTRDAMPLMGCFFIGGFIIQIIVGILDLKSGNLAGGNTFLYFSAYFMLVSGIEMFLKYYYPSVDTRVDGWAWLALWLVVLLWTPAFYKTPALLFIIVIGLNVALPFIVMNDLKLFTGIIPKIFANISAYALLFCGSVGIYLSAAMVVNGTYGKTIFPNPKPFYNR